MKYIALLCTIVCPFSGILLSEGGSLEPVKNQLMQCIIRGDSKNFKDIFDSIKVSEYDAEDQISINSGFLPIPSLFSHFHGRFKKGTKYTEEDLEKKPAMITALNECINLENYAINRAVAMNSWKNSHEVVTASRYAVVAVAMIQLGILCGDNQIRSVDYKGTEEFICNMLHIPSVYVPLDNGRGIAYTLYFFATVALCFCLKSFRDFWRFESDQKKKLEGIEEIGEMIGIKKQ